MTRLKSLIDLTNLHSFRLPAKAESVICLTNEQQLHQLPANAYVLGAGSNTLFINDFTCPIIRVELTGIVVEETFSSWRIDVAAGENWHNFVCQMMERHIYGFENLALIPGTVGAAPVQNIGAYGREVSDFIVTVVAWDRQRKCFVRFNNKDCLFAYRDSKFKREAGRWLITRVEFEVPKSWLPEVSYGELKALSTDATAEDIFKQVIAIRQRKLPDPTVTPNAGSFFKNPIVSRERLAMLLERFPAIPHYCTSDDQVKLAAGWLIDNLNLKGYQIGGAAVHQNQALVLINKENATGDDVLSLAKHIKAKVNAAYGIDLEAEVRLLGKQGLITL